jgi:serine/threonine-protein kinase
MTLDQSLVTDPQREAERLTPVVPGQVLGDRYRVDEPLGTGGMGVVCRATHIGLGTPVAIKLIRPDFTADEEFVRRFLNEARRAALLRSERIARVHDVGQLATGEPFLVMELLEGLELGDYLEEHGALPTADAVNIAIQLAEGLEVAHRSGIVHRDIKPANTFLVRRPDGRFAVKILDFGISKQITEGVTTLTDARQSLGSPWYMSPEQMLDAAHVDARSDLWSLGVVLFEMLTGRRPFDGETVPEVCAKVLATPAPPLSELRPDLDPELAAIVARCLEKDASERFPSAASLGAALSEYLAHGQAPADTSVVPTVPFDMNANEGSIAPVATLGATRRRRRHLAQALGVLGILVTLGVAALAFGKRAAVSARHGAARIEALTARAAAPAPAPAPASPVAAPSADLSNPADVSAPAEISTPAAVSTPAEISTPAAVSTPAAAPVLANDFDAGVAPASDAAPAAAPSSAPSAGSAPAPTTPAPARTAPSRPFERPLTPAEIEARKARYARWLADEGLEPIE